MNDMQKTLELFTSEKRLYTFVCELTHLHPSETQHRRQNCQCEPGLRHAERDEPNQMITEENLSIIHRMKNNTV
jgi:hypothetical protein